MSAAATRIPAAEAREVAERFRHLIADVCERVSIAGSLRRQATLVGDIEIVAVPKLAQVVERDMFGGVASQYTVDLLDARLAKLLEHDLISKRVRADGRTMWGPSARLLTYEGLPIDLFSPCRERFGWILLLRTGPEAFSRQLVVPRGKRTKDGREGLLPERFKPRDGWLTERVSGRRIETPEETDVFNLIGLAYREPWERR